jgi:hypothetical protein
MNKMWEDTKRRRAAHRHREARKTSVGQREGKESRDESNTVAVIVT